MVITTKAGKIMNYLFASKTALFQGISASDIEKMRTCLAFSEAAWKKNEAILSCGARIAKFGLVLSGSVRIENIDLWGNRSVLAIVKQGATFAEAYAIAEHPLMVDVFANEACDIVFMDIQRLLKTCAEACTYHARLIQNLLMLNANKNLTLSQRMFDISAKTIRGRLRSYLSREAALQRTNAISIPFDRQQLADYLGVERSALSKELAKMKKDGLLDYRKNRFSIHFEQVQKG